MDTLQVLQEELGDKRMERLEENGLSVKVQWAMRKYHEVESSNTQKINGDTLKIRRVKLKLKISEVKEDTGVSTGTISRIENGKDAMHSEFLKLDTYYSQLEMQG